MKSSPWPQKLSSVRLKGSQKPRSGFCSSASAISSFCAAPMVTAARVVCTGVTEGAYDTTIACVRASIATKEAKWLRAFAQNNLVVAIRRARGRQV